MSTYSWACWLPDDCQPDCWTELCWTELCWTELCWTLELCCWKPEDIWKAALEDCCMLDSGERNGQLGRQELCLTHAARRWSWTG
jgi:hypothetical protein